MDRTKACLCLVILISVLPIVAFATWEEGGNYLGPTLGLSFLGSTPQFGANFEHAIETESMGTIGIGGVFRYWSYSEDFGGFYGSDVGKWKYSNLLIGVQGNYHFTFDNENLDPWVGLTLAYDVGSVSWDGVDEGGFNDPSVGGLWLAAGAGMRYFVSPNMAIVGRLNFGSLSYSALDLGVDFAF